MIGHNSASENNINQQYAPFVTPEKYSDLAGLSLDAVKGMVKNGKLPVIHRQQGRKGRIFINMVALKAYADELAQDHQEWKAAI